MKKLLILLGLFLVLSNPVESAYEMNTGTYTGNATDNRNIGGVGFQPDLVIVHGTDAGQVGTYWIPFPGGDSSYFFAAFSNFADRIQSVGADGFQVGASGNVNTNNDDYYWACFKFDATDSEYGSYTGNSVDDRDISFTNSFQAEMMLTKANGKNEHPYWTSESLGAGNSLNFVDTAIRSNFIQSLATPGQFQVGDNNAVNDATFTYGYWAFQEASANMNSGSYVGDGNDNRSITIGFQPEYVWIKKGSEPVARGPLARLASNSSGECLRFSGGAEVTDAIQAFEVNGFQIGQDNRVNENGGENPTYYWVAWRTPGVAPAGLLKFPMVVGCLEYEFDEVA